MKKHSITATFKKNIIFIVLALFILCIIASGTIYFYNYTTGQLYHESVSQLEELSDQLFEKMGIQIDLQWSYLEKLESTLYTKSTMTIDELAENLEHLETDLAPADKTIKFRAIDDDGYYYTHDGRHGTWTGLDKIDGSINRQSFLIVNWSDDTENYMAFTIRLSKTVTVGKRTLTHIALLRSMEDMQPFFHSTAFDDNNSAYVIDSDGFILFADESLEGVRFEGLNLSRNMENYTYPHYKTFDAVWQESLGGGTVCTDLTIKGEKYYLIFNQLPQYDWGVLLLVSGDSVATSSTEMVTSLVRVFIISAGVLILALLATFAFVTKIQKDRVLIHVKEQNEKTLEEKNQLLENLNQSLVESQEEAEKNLELAKSATKAKSQFLANMSHDIRTPMNAIIGVTKLMEHEVNNPEKLSYYIDKLRHSGQYMLGLINDILDMSKIETGDVHLNIEPVKMAEQFGQIESIIRSQCNEKEQEFTVTVHEIRHEYVMGDSIRIRQVFLNLLSNSVKYTQNGGSVRFEVREIPCDIPDHATFITSVIDNGYGMSEEFQKHMFEPFARETNSVTNKQTGTGLGLSITKSIVDMMQGTIECHSEKGKGTRFDVYLTVPVDHEGKHASGVAKSMLLVAKDELLIQNIKTALQDDGIELRIVSDTEEAVKALEEKPAETILLSGYIEKENLAETVKTLRATAKDATFIFCCDYKHRDQVRDMLIDSGVDGLIARPFFIENFILAVGNAKAESATPEHEHHSPLNDKKFLCAEDNELNAEILEALLAMHGATCKICTNGEEIVKEFENVKEGDYDAILMDVQMPVMNGMDATRAIRSGKNPLGKTFPIIAMTANAFSSDVQDCLNAGMDAHLAKPLDIVALERVMQDISTGNAEGRAK